MLASEAIFWFIVAWLIAMGGAIGSFLNVVVYRLPLGLSLVYPPSHCPKCGKPIAWHDNVPVLGWLALRGRCRQCHNPISMRYPLVEAVTAAMFGAVAVAELPLLSVREAYGVYPLHMLLLCTLLCAGLIEYDGARAPWRLFLPALVAGLVGPWLWPSLLVAREWAGPPNWLEAIGILGVLSLIVIGGWQTYVRKSPGLLLCLLCTGLSVGRSGLEVIAAATTCGCLLLWVLRRVWPRLHVPTSMAFGFFTLVWTLVWATAL